MNGLVDHRQHARPEPPYPLTMPYSASIDLPGSVRDHLPPHAREIYREAFNDAWTRYPGPRQEEVAHRIAWAAVKRSYVHRDGQWVPRNPTG